MRKHYGSRTAGQIARHLGRSVGSVYQHANQIGVVKARDRDNESKEMETIRRLHAEGFNAAEIQAKTGVPSRTVNLRLNRMGLKPHGRHERYRKKAAKRAVAQCKAAGVKSLGELRSKEMKRVARGLGWPESLSLRAVQILETLYRCGPMTRKQIAEAIGMRWNGSRRTFSNSRVPGHSYLAELQRAGLVVRLESAITHKGKGNHQDLYLVALEVEPCQEARETYQSQVSSERST